MKRKDIVVTVLLLVFMALQIVWVILAGMEKAGYFVDELWGCGLANGFYHPHIYSDDIFLSNQYVGPEFFRDYLEVTTDAFRYDSVFYNLSQDSHPPLYFCILHTVFSFFPYQFSKWYGIVPNLAFFLTASVFLYLIGCRLFRDRFLSMIPVILWGFSTQTVSYVLMIRMYMMLTMWTLMDAWIHGKYLETGRFEGRKQILLLMIVNICGCLTHYYYYVFAFFLSGFTVLFHFRRKETRQAVTYAKVMFGAVGLALLLFPGIIVTFFTRGARGRGAVGAVLRFWDFWKKLRGFSVMTKEKAFYGGNFLILLCALVCAGILIVLFLRKGCREEYEEAYNVKKGRYEAGLNTVQPETGRLYGAILTLTAVTVFAAVAKISPFIADRYSFMVSPYLWLLAVWFPAELLKRHPRFQYGVCILMAVIGLSTAYHGKQAGKVMYLFPKEAEVQSVLQKYAGDSCIFIAGKEREYAAGSYVLDFQLFSKTLFIGQEKPLEEYDISDSGPEMIVYIDSELKQEPVLDALLAKTRYTSYEIIARGVGVSLGGEEEHYIYRLF